MKYYEEIKKELIDNEIHKRVKEYSKNQYELERYYHVGKLLFQAGKHYGEGIIREYSNRLTMDLGKGYSKRNLWLMLRFYELKEKVQTLSAQLSWSHYCELLPIKNIEEIKYYITLVERNSLSVRELREKRKRKEYERLPKEKIIKKEKKNISDFIKNPILIPNDHLEEEVSERMLQKLILDNIEYFMKELGTSFSFVGSEYKIKLGDTYNYIDLLFFNIEFNCYVVVELKVTELKKEHIGQIEIYMNYIDSHMKKFGQEKTVGVIICKRNKKYVIEYCSDKRIISRVYEWISL